MEQKIKQFTDLVVWQQAHALVLQAYRLTKRFPKEELFGLTSQVRRAAVSITSNIAEGFSRQSYREKVQFYSLAAGSLTELQSQFLIAHDLGYIVKADFDGLKEILESVHKLLNAFIRKSKSIRDA